jgi:hypothetical protein
VYSPSATGYPAVASTTIESAKYNAVIADIATALTLSIAANGETTITANIPLAGYKITGLGNASADTDALNRVTADARYAALTSPTFTGSVIVSTAQPIYWLVETDGASNEKRWAIQGNAGGFYVSAFNDAADTATNAISVSRNGITINTIALAATTVSITGSSTVNTIDVTPTEGTFTAYLRASNGSADLSSATASWKKSQGIVTLYIPLLIHAGAGTTLVVDQLPAAIQPTATYYVMAPGWDNGAEVSLRVTLVNGADYLNLSVMPGAGGFNNATASKGINACVITYVV